MSLSFTGKALVALSITCIVGLSNAQCTVGEEIARPVEVRLKILTPVTSGDAHSPPPLLREVLQRLKVDVGAIKHAHMQLVCEYVDPPRVYPLIGPAKLHHAMYKCTIDTENVSQSVIVVQNHFQMIGE